MSIPKVYRFIWRHLNYIVLFTLLLFWQLPASSWCLRFRYSLNYQMLSFSNRKRFNNYWFFSDLIVLTQLKVKFLGEKITFCGVISVVIFGFAAYVQHQAKIPKDSGHHSQRCCLYYNNGADVPLGWIYCISCI